MIRVVAGLLLLVLPGCCLLCPKPAGDIVPARRETPEEAYALLRAAVIKEKPDLIYEGLSEGLKQRFGITDPRTFKLAYEQHRSDFEDLAWALERAEVTGVREFVKDGRRYAEVTVGALGRSAGFLLVDLPVREARVAIEGYDPATMSEHLPGTDFSSAMKVRDGRIQVAPLDASDTGIDSASQVLRLTFEHRWLLDDVPADAPGLVPKPGDEPEP